MPVVRGSPVSIEAVCRLAHVVRGLEWLVGLEVFLQELVDSEADVGSFPGVYAVEGVSACSGLVYFVLEFLAVGLEALYQVLDLEYVHVIVVGVGIDEQGGFELVGVPYGRAALVLLHVLRYCGADVI